MKNRTYKQNAETSTVFLGLRLFFFYLFLLYLLSSAGTAVTKTYLMFENGALKWDQFWRDVKEKKLVGAFLIFSLYHSPKKVGILILTTSRKTTPIKNLSF